MLIFRMIVEALLYGVIQGITEWLPISSTGHLILFRKLISGDFGLSDEFFDLFFVIIQLFSVFAVVVLFHDKLFPSTIRKNKSEFLHRWGIIVVGMMPLCILGFILDEIAETYLSHISVISAALIIYGIIFIVIEKTVKRRRTPIEKIDDITYRQALSVGMFQVLAVVPGTSRSGSTIIGAMLSGISRQAAAEYSFLLAVPVMLGASVLKITKCVLIREVYFSMEEWIFLSVGCISAFFVSLITVKFLTEYVKKHSFVSFGIYRIIIGIAVIILNVVK